MKSLIISPKILKKIKEKHDVDRREVEQCFENRAGTFLVDERDSHITDPPTL